MAAIPRTRLVINAFTDGSCKGNPGIGGWGWTASITAGETGPVSQWSDWGGKDKTTNQQMELHAMADFLEFCPVGSDIEVRSDSMYVLNGIAGVAKKAKTATQSDLVLVNPIPQGWLRGWVKFGAVLGTPYTSSYWVKNPPPKNGDEWYRIHQSLLNHARWDTTIKFGWVKGHVGIEGNEIADALANMYPEMKSEERCSQ